MDDIVARIVIFAIVGLVSGFISGLFGIGGGTVRVPIFFYLLPLIGVNHSVVMHLATATSLVRLAGEKAKLGRVWPHMLRHSCGY